MHHWAGSPEQQRKTPWTQTQHTCCTTCCEVTVEHCNTAWQWYNNEHVQRSINNRTSHWSVFRTSWSSTYTECIRDKTMQLLLLYLSVEHVCFHRENYGYVLTKGKPISCICLTCPGCSLKTCSWIIVCRRKTLIGMSTVVVHIETAHPRGGVIEDG